MLEERRRCRNGYGDFLEREGLLLSRISGDPTVGSLRDEKESCSTWRDLRVGTGFEEF